MTQITSFAFGCNNFYANVVFYHEGKCYMTQIDYDNDTVLVYYDSGIDILVYYDSGIDILPLSWSDDHIRYAMPNGARRIPLPRGKDPWGYLNIYKVSEKKRRQANKMQRRHMNNWT